MRLPYRLDLFRLILVRVCKKVSFPNFTVISFFMYRAVQHTLYHVSLYIFLMPILGMLILHGLLSRHKIDIVCICYLFLFVIFLFIIIIITTTTTIIIIIIRRRRRRRRRKRRRSVWQCYEIIFLTRSCGLLSIFGILFTYDAYICLLHRLMEICSIQKSQNSRFPKFCIVPEEGSTATFRKFMCFVTK